MGLCLAVSIAGMISKIKAGTNNRLIINVPDMPAPSTTHYGRYQTCIATAHERSSQTNGTSCIATLSNMQYVNATQSVDFVFEIEELGWSSDMSNPSVPYPVGKKLQFNALILIPKLNPELVAPIL